MAKLVNPLMPVVAAALIDSAGRVLLQERPPGKHMAGLWEFPGGKVENGESPELALSRELLEELGIIVAPEDFTALTFASAPLEGKHLLLLLYVCREWTGTPEPHEATALRWVLPSEMEELPMPPADAPFVAVLQQWI